VSLAIPLHAAPRIHDDDIAFGLPATIWAGDRFHPGRDAVPLPGLVVDALRDGTGFVHGVHVRFECEEDALRGTDVLFDRRLVRRDADGRVVAFSEFVHVFKQSPVLPTFKMMRRVGLTLGIVVHPSAIWGGEGA